MATIDSSVITSMSVREHFSVALETATRNQDVALRDATSAYLVNMLTDYCNAATFAEVCDGGRHIKPLALLYADALAAEHVLQRRRTLQKLGDIALFIAGIFSDSLQRRAVDVDYYIGMGEAAYGCLHDSLQGSARARAADDLFDELGRKFGTLVDVLGEISEMSGLKSNSNITRTYEIWLKTGSARARRQLAQSGVHPLKPRTARAMH